jgi:hypothetical protein
MLIAAHVLGYAVDRFLPDCLAGLIPHVDKLFVGYSTRPFSYNPASRLTETNPTPQTSFLSLGLGEKLEIIDGDWEAEEDARNACLSVAQQQGFDWLLVIDADELYTDESWSQLLRLLRTAHEYDHVITTWYNFFKSSHYVLVERDGSIKSTNAGFAVRCRSDIRFRHKRLTNASRSLIVDCPCYHYGYVMSDAEMLTKINTWSHAADFDSTRWFRLKWQNWTLNTRNLHPTSPTSWQKAIRFPLVQPDFAHKYALPVEPLTNTSFGISLDNLAYDAHAHGIRWARQMKAALAGISKPKSNA